MGISLGLQVCIGNKTHLDLMMALDEKSGIIDTPAVLSEGSMNEISKQSIQSMLRHVRQEVTLRVYSRVHFKSIFACARTCWCFSNSSLMGDLMQLQVSW